MAVIDGRTVRWAEYIGEETLGTTPTNPTMLAFPGDLVGIDVQSGPEMESYKILKGATDTDPLSCGESVKTGETHQVTITLKVSGVTWLPYILLGATTSAYAPGIVSHPISIGLVAGTEYCVLEGCGWKSAVLDFPDTRTAATLTLTFMCIGKTDWSETDYKGTGSHASAPTAAPYTMSSITLFEYDDVSPDTSDVYLESLKISIENDIEPVYDLSSEAASKIGDWSFLSRSMQVDMGMSMIGMGVHDDILDGDAHKIDFTLGTKAFTFSNLYWTNAPSVNLSPASKVGMTLTSDGEATRIAIA
ncbi:hypothetical protein [Methanolobus psychrotolerans]|uniref:hypothetical protein n=1 Tax=Methanolobus psychrotolerans TaxID=1874706 RepID=UPI000B919D8B|nr:hypothetical protein [Methanolobus psychrotolerans]